MDSQALEAESWVAAQKKVRTGGKHQEVFTREGQVMD